ncbi:hypothetical protein VTH82DRAFT_4940 [Thermothelomyces myriococcoides]
MPSGGLAGVGVPPSQPVWLLYIKAVVIVLSLVVMGLSGYVLSNQFIQGGPASLDMFTAIFSILTYGVTGAFELWLPNNFYRIGGMVCYPLSIIFWLSAWAYSAHGASVWISFGLTAQLGGPMAGCAAIGAVIWVLTIVHFFFFVRACLSDSGAGAGAGAGPAELGQVKVEGGQYPQYGQQSYPAQQPGAYPAQQPYPAQDPYAQYPQQPAQQYPQQYPQQQYPPQ